MKKKKIKKEEETIQIIGKTKYFIGLYPKLEKNLNIDDWIESTYNFFHKEDKEKDINLTDISKILKTQGLSIDFVEFENLYLKYEKSMKQKKIKKEEEETIQIIGKTKYFIGLYPKLEKNLNIDDWIESTYNFFHKEDKEKDINLTDIAKILKTQGLSIDFVEFENLYFEYEETMKQEKIKKEEETIQIIGKTKYFIDLYPKLERNLNINDWINCTYKFFNKEDNKKDINLKDIAKILKTQGIVSIDFVEFETLYLKYEKDYLLIKPFLEKFLIQFIDENVYPVGYITNEDTIKAFSLVIKEDVGLEISFSLLQEYVENERETKELAIYEHIFLIDNPELVDNYDLKFWIKAYLKTFGNNMDYRYYFEKLLKLKKIDIYSTEITAKEIEKQYRISHNEMINEETDKDWMDSFINTQVN